MKAALAADGREEDEAEGMVWAAGERDGFGK